jgi:hypothetical protein
MIKRGRPNKNGAKPGRMLLRSVMVLDAYDQARGRGEKRSAAITDSVSTVCSRVPEMPISETEVKRVLAEFRSKDCEEAWIFKEGIAQGPKADAWFDMLEWIAKQSRGKWEVPSFSQDKSKPRRLRTWAIQKGPAPRYPRHNSRS